MNNTETNYINHINQEKNKTPLDDVIDVIDDANAYVDIIKENINYSGYMRSQNLEIREMYDELFQVICEVVCVKRRTVNVGGQKYPYELVRSRFLKLNNSHLEYTVIDNFVDQIVFDHGAFIWYLNPVYGNEVYK